VNIVKQTQNNNEYKKLKYGVPCVNSAMQFKCIIFQTGKTAKIIAKSSRIFSSKSEFESSYTSEVGAEKIKGIQKNNSVTIKPAHRNHKIIKKKNIRTLNPK
jgi:hypothetical protein